MLCLLIAGVLLAGELRWVMAIEAAAAQTLNLRQKLIVVRVQHQEHVAIQESKAQMALVQGVAEKLIDSTTQTTRETHQRIADVPFSVFEGIPATRDAAKAARGVHDVTSTGVYAAVSLLNKGVGKGLRGFLQAGDDAAKTVKQHRLKNSGSSDDDKSGDEKP